MGRDRTGEAGTAIGASSAPFIVGRSSRTSQQRTTDDQGRKGIGPHVVGLGVGILRILRRVAFFRRPGRSLKIGRHQGEPDGVLFAFSRDDLRR